MDRAAPATYWLGFAMMAATALLLTRARFASPSKTADPVLVDA
jgi:hypothetical protein